MTHPPLPLPAAPGAATATAPPGPRPFVLDPAGRDLHGEAARLRALGPAVLVELPAGIRAWSINTHDLLKTLLTDDRVSKDPRRHWPAWQRGEHHDTWIRTWVGVHNMDTAYGPEHRRLRKLVAPTFTGRRTRAMLPRVRHAADRLLDALADTAPGDIVDLRAAYAHPLPMQVICDLFGVPETSRPRLARLMARAMDTTLTPDEAEQTVHEVDDALTALVAHRRSHPGDDLTSALVAARDDDGSHLSERELLDTLLLVIGAGNETTVNLIGNAVHALLTHPDQLRLVLDGTVSWHDAIEETLRWAPSVANVPLRYAVEDIALPGGPTIRKGEAILAAYAAAGRDPDRHGPTADRFDITRPGRGAAEHLAFGHGVHFCPGAPLARTEAAVALPALFDRFPGIHLAAAPGGPAPTEGFIAYGHHTLPVRLTALHPAARNPRLRLEEPGAARNGSV
ncbi:cytochrome P450 [Streptomyces pristinaespiralis]|uniref:Cytochrome P450 n=1 Tax=Streptomyces pristinaespiralis TaxID=38300 RepID=A0A0M4D015_STRPR|nr:cytochrome P450 [Streptomyces pristinaespiralis]ALC18441.1 cytochrome P450 [Streptomyces pristinaespiralis]ALC25524.1 cytochrome P450 [Streptomyces pristinaespiralis]